MSVQYRKRGKRRTNNAGWKMQDRKMKDQKRTKDVISAGLENAEPIMQGGKFRTGKCGTKTAGVENTGLN